MDIVILLLKQNFIMFIYLMIGYFLFKKKLVSQQGCADIGKMLLYIIMPVAIFRSYVADFSWKIFEGLTISFVAAVLSLLLSICVSRLFFSSDQAVERFGAAFSNAGFIGIPLVQMTLGGENVIYISSFVALLNILQWTYGVLAMTGDRQYISFKKIRTNPIVISFLAGIAVFLMPVAFPETIHGVIGTVSSMNGPLAMIVLGIYLGQIPLAELFTERIVYKCVVIRLILIPALTILLMMALPAEHLMIKLAVLIVASAPVGSNVAIFAQLFDQDYSRSVKEVCLSTLACIITMPMLIGIASAIL
ncbi:MAG: hypothetical protein HFG98_04150 [Dorea sp.]|nr:hypothetical protein [Dorea sp.]